MSKPIDCEEGRVDLGQPELFRSWTWNVDLDGLAAEAGSGELEPILASASRVSPGLTPDQRLAEFGHRAVLEPQLGLEPELDLLGLVERLAVLVERQVGGDEVAELGAPFELGHELGVALEELLELRPRRRRR